MHIDNDDTENDAITTDTLTSSPGADYDNIDAEVGKRLKSFRVQVDKTQADIAAWLEISPQQYQKYEKGASKCNIANLYRLAEYYERPITDLLPGVENQYSPGFREQEETYSPNKNSALTDEAAAMAELLAVFVRIPSKKMRSKILNLLSDMLSS